MRNKLERRRFVFYVKTSKKAKENEITIIECPDGIFRDINSVKTIIRHNLKGKYQRGEK